MQPTTVFCFVLICSIGAINCTNSLPQKDDFETVDRVEVDKLDLTHGTDHRVDRFSEQQRHRRATCNFAECDAFCRRRQFRGVCVQNKCKCT
ncbi:hypothetical protein CpipJ_CPIJ001275 [Culex quinquefasciatus]|uniref:Defensin n=1 Tax=Culex quinquefasciatus TaxID=7176 RepID=B0W2M5_CULQU|nr:hypothetical protein CpipJ_CPIJ001275 [Culex quinquefasciatus]|eukprot:XP_001842944.1 hypothetical protein CpipJ_CPIJ001275 [Culex quinquefasciatus]